MSLEPRVATHAPAKPAQAPTRRTVCVDANLAAAHSAYAMSDVSFVFPITPSTPMSQAAEEWSARLRPNTWGRGPVLVRQMQSEAGVAGAFHGALRAGALASTFTSSQGLLLMVPVLHKVAGESLPLVAHVAARAVSAQTVTIFPDHSDVYAVRSTGVSMLSSHSVQDAADLSLVAHIAAIRSGTPFVHFFEGMQLSHEMASCELPTDEQIAALAPRAEAEAFRARAALSSAHPTATGVVVGRSTFWQHAEADNLRTLSVPSVVAAAMSDVARATGRRAHAPFEYCGHPAPDRVAVAMGAGAETVERAVARLNARGERVGLVKVHLFRPWSDEMFLSALPPTPFRLVVLDRARELGAAGEPLFLDCLASLARAGHPAAQARPLGARYGVGGFEFSVEMVEAVFAEASKDRARPRFAVGLIDDVTHLSLPLDRRTPGESVPPEGDGITRCVTWGVGGDGAVGACKSVAQVVSGSGLRSQAIFEYGAHKNGGITTSHVRYGSEQPSQHAGIGPGEADYVVCHVAQHLAQYGVAGHAKLGGTLILNTPATSAVQLQELLPASVLRQIAERRLKVFVVDASKIAKDVGAGHISLGLAMQSAFLRVSGAAGDRGTELLKDAAAGKHGGKSTDADELARRNRAAVDAADPKLVEYDSASWTSLPLVEKKSTSAEEPDYVKEIVRPLQALEGADIPVSAFLKHSVGGCTAPGTAAFEKRGTAEHIPEWDPERCTRCNRCSFVCPHSAIRSVVFREGEQSVPQNLASLSVPDTPSGTKFRIQVSPQDCTGCGMCTEACPTKSLSMKPYSDAEAKNWTALVEKRAGRPGQSEVDKALSPSSAGTDKSKASVRSLAGCRPGLEFAGSCSGCPQPVYVRALTQVVGDRLTIANGVGCSTVWGGTAYSNPYTADPETGRGAAWACSLLEDAAEFGYGVSLASSVRRKSLRAVVKKALQSDRVSPGPLHDALNEWLEKWEDGSESLRLQKKMDALLGAIGEAAGRELLRGAWDARDLFAKPSTWVVGGDGWAYDIGFGGVDHVISTGEPLKMLVLDNENYANTGGQASRATPQGAIAKLASTGKASRKRDLGLHAALYGNTYVASVCYGANMEQTVRALADAEAFPGPAIVLCYCPCIEHGIAGGIASGKELAHMREAVSSGYWPLYRFDPRRALDGLSPLQFDGPFSQKTSPKSVQNFVKKEGRFQSLARSNPATSKNLIDGLEASIMTRVPLLKAASDALLSTHAPQKK